MVHTGRSVVPAGSPAPFAGPSSPRGIDALEQADAGLDGPGVAAKVYHDMPPIVAGGDESRRGGFRQPSVIAEGFALAIMVVVIRVEQHDVRLPVQGHFDHV